MSPAARHTVIWSLTAWFAALVGVGEGWHAFPGNGHWVQLPGGAGMYVGYCGAPRTCGTQAEEAAWDQGERDPLLLKDEEACAICRLSSQDRLPRASLDCTVSDCFEQRAPLLARPAAYRRVPHPFRARAPPLV